MADLVQGSSPKSEFFVYVPTYFSFLCYRLSGAIRNSMKLFLGFSRVRAAHHESKPILTFDGQRGPR